MPTTAELITAALPNRLKAALVASLQSLALPEIGPKVYEQMLAEDSNTAFPYLLCSDDGLTEKLLRGDTEHKEAEYPVQVSLVVRAGPKEHQVAPELRYWRKTVFDFLHEQQPRAAVGPLGGIPELQWVLVEMRLIVDPKLAEFQRLVSGLTVWFHVLEPRLRNRLR